VVEALAGANLVSDERFVEARIAARRQRGYGPVHIRRDLEEKGIDRELIDRWVDTNDREWLSDLREVKQKKFGARAPANAAERARQMRFYQYRGFTMDQIRKILGQNNDTSQD